MAELLSETFVSTFVENDLVNLVPSRGFCENGEVVISDSKVQSVLEKLNVNSVVGSNALRLCLEGLCCAVIKSTSYRFLQSRELPELWSRSLFMLIFKSKCKCDTCNFCLVSLISVISRWIYIL